jgi:hypothetical protein
VSWAQLVEAARRRSTGAHFKRRTAIVQGLSALVFLAVALWRLPHAPGLLFAAEAAGQALLALDNLRSEGSEVVYFRRNALGRAALCVFSLVIGARCALALRVTSSPAAVLAGFVALGLTQLSPLVLGRVRSDLCAGAAIAGSALLLAYTTFGAAPLFAATQLLYAAVLVFGVLALEPWKAEALNVPVFASAALWSVIA